LLQKTRHIRFTSPSFARFLPHFDQFSSSPEAKWKGKNYPFHQSVLDELSQSNMSKRSINGLRILVTGASQGIGRALALRAASQGARVLAAARSQPLLQELADEASRLGHPLAIVHADVTSDADRQAMVDAAQESLGGLDVLVNNAGIGATGHFVDASQDRLRKIMEVNFFGLTETTRVFLPLLKAGNHPAIMNISSIAARRGIPARSEYSASKFAVQGFSEALRAELSKDNIDVLVVSPGLTQTNFSQNMLEQKALLKMDHLRGMTAEAVADATLVALAKGKAETTLTLQGKLLVLVSRFLPRLADRIAARKVRSLFKQERTARNAPVSRRVWAKG
jgi:short-subunit dehydrogenase